MQLTAGALTGRFGTRAQYWSERMLDEGMFQIIATDAHDLVRRPPALREALSVLAQRVGEAEAWSMISTRPRGVVANVPPHDLTAPQRVPALALDEPFFQRLGNMLRGGVR
jgi:protein-tyrosine phosphatase